VRRTIERALLRRQAVPTLAVDGDEAEELLRTHEFDVLLFDVMMPKKTGYDLVPIARETQPDAPVILMSGYAEQAELEAPDAFLEKPFTVTGLEGIIQAALRGERTE
jgi:two-component system autoinducer 1 sensor kinase/phosphatase LuxN